MCCKKKRQEQLDMDDLESRFLCWDLEEAFSFSEVFFVAFRKLEKKNMFFNIESKDGMV